MPVKKFADAKQLPWKPRYSAHCTRERANARVGRKNVSQLYDAMCHLCGKVFPDVQSKEEHAMKHTTNLGPGRVRCNECNTIHEPGKPIYRHFLGVHTGHGFHCLVKRCGKGFTDKKCTVDHHYVYHKLHEYTKIPPRYKCETAYIRHLSGAPDNARDPDPTGEHARSLQPRVSVGRMPDDELLFYLNFPEVLEVTAGIKKVFRTRAFSPIKDEQGKLVVPLEPKGEEVEAPFIKVLITQDFADSLPQVLHQIPGLVDESVEPMIPLRNSEVITSLDSLNQCLISLTSQNSDRDVKEVCVDIAENLKRDEYKENIPMNIQ